MATVHHRPKYFMHKIRDKFICSSFNIPLFAKKKSHPVFCVEQTDQMFHKITNSYKFDINVQNEDKIMLGHFNPGHSRSQGNCSGTVKLHQQV